MKFVHIINTQGFLTKPERRQMFRIGTCIYFAHLIIGKYVIATLQNKSTLTTIAYAIGRMCEANPFHGKLNKAIRRLARVFRAIGDKLSNTIEF